MANYVGELLLKFNGKPLAYVQSCTVNMATAFQDVTNKDSGDFEEIEPGLKSWGASGDGLASVVPDANKSDTSALINAWMSQACLDVVFNAADNAFSFTGKAYIEKLDLSSKTKERPTFSFSVKGNGAPTPATKSLYSVDNLIASMLSDTSLSLTYNVAGNVTKIGLEASNDGANGWAKVGADIVAAPYKSYQILTVAAGTKYYRAWVSDASNVKVYSNIVKVTI